MIMILMRTKAESLEILLENVVHARNDLDAVFLYSKQGLLISRYPINTDQDEELYGALSNVAEGLSDKIKQEYHFRLI